jgi:chromate transporter
MRDDSGTLITIATHFALLSLFAVGGATSSVPELHRQSVEVQHWMTDRQFSELFAIAQAAPGPNVMIVTLIGQQAAGVVGGLIATAAMCVPSCVLAFVVHRIFERFKEARWRNVIHAGLVPLMIGLVAASALIVAQSADHGWPARVITIATAVFVYWTRVTPLLPLGLAAALGLTGLL